MKLTIHNIQTIQEEGGWYKIGGEVTFDTDTDKLQIEQICRLLNVNTPDIYLSDGSVNPIFLQWLSRKYIEYIITSDLEERRKQAR